LVGASDLKRETARVRNAARTLLESIRAKQSGRLVAAGQALVEVMPRAAALKAAGPAGCR
jgi:hypothetical protein